MKRNAKINIGSKSDDFFGAQKGINIVYGKGGADTFQDSDTNAADYYYGGKGDDFIFTNGGHDC